jgi:serine phosphatase RsbU (regulator of sigma subunit)
MILPLFVAVSGAFQVAAAAAPPDVVLITPEAVDEGIQLREGWRFRAGDDPGWAQPDFDDRDWQMVDSGAIEFGVEQAPIGWLRRRLRVDPGLVEPVAGLRVRQTGASELYLDGRKLTTLGTVNADPGREVAWDPALPVAVALEPGAEHLLAVRLSLAHDHELRDGFRGFELRLGNLEELTQRSTHFLRRLIPFMAGAAGLAGALALVHGLLFILDRRSREHAYFAVFAGFLSLDVFADMMTNFIADFDVRLLWFRPGVVFLVAMLLAGIQLELVLFERRRGWTFWGLAAAGLAIIAWAWTIPGFRNITLLVVFMMLAVAEMLRLAVSELLQRRPDSGVVAAGLAILALSFVNFFGAYFGLRSLPTGLSVLVGWGGAAVSLSLYIARRTSRTNRELRDRLDEVAELTERAIEQERNAARELAERRVLEAENERKTREFERARALQVAMLPRDRPRLDSVDVAFRMRTATEVGGDYYDFVADDRGRCTIAVGDAIGHGMHAGMVVAVAKSLFTTLSPTHEPTRLLEEVSNRLAGLSSRGASMAMAFIRIESTKLQVAAAAMPPLLVWRCANRAIEEVPLSATPLGVRLRGRFAEAELKLAPGDAVLVSTDGLAEILDPEGNPWGYEGMAEAYRRHAHRDPEDILDALLETGEAYAGEGGLSDDVTLVAIKAREGRDI